MKSVDRRTALWHALSIVAIVSSGCSSNRFDTIVVRQYWDIAKTKIASEYSVLENDQSVKHGSYRAFDTDGIPWKFCSYTLGKEDGTIVELHKNGRFRSTVSVADGKYTGIETVYSMSGQVALVREFRDDKPWTILYMCGSDGKTISAGDFANGNGTVNYNGSILAGYGGRGVYVDGERDGLWIMFENGDGGEIKYQFKHGFHVDKSGVPTGTKFH